MAVTVRFRTTAVVAAAATLALGAGPPPQASRSATPVLIGRHPAAFDQPSMTGMTIATLQPFNGQIYVGYGDYSSDSGPIEVVAVDVESGTLGESRLSFASEAIFLFRRIGDRLYAPDIDPRRTREGGYAMGVADASGDRWSDHKPVRATHIFDVASFDGSDLWLFGSLGSTATAWRSVDGGETWTVALSVPTVSGEGLSRMYSAFTLAGKLYTQVVDFPDGDQPASLVYDGTGWSPGPRLLPETVLHVDAFPWKPVRVGDKVLYMDDHTGVTQFMARLYRFDGETAEFAFGADQHETGRLRDYFFDFTVSDDGTAYALNRMQEVWSSTDLVDWTHEATLRLEATEVATSIAVVGDDLYFGTHRSGIYKMPLR
jgi:hypothetical protein